MRFTTRHGIGEWHEMRGRVPRRIGARLAVLLMLSQLLPLGFQPAARAADTDGQVKDMALHQPSMGVPKESCYSLFLRVLQQFDEAARALRDIMILQPDERGGCRLCSFDLQRMNAGEWLQAQHGCGYDSCSEAG